VVASSSRAEWRDLYQRADRVIQEARELREDHCFVVSWLHTRPASNARHTRLLDGNESDPQRAASLLNGAAGTLRVPPSGGRDRDSMASRKGWAAILCRFAPFEAHGEQKCSERLHWSQRDARREAEGWAHAMGQKPIRWELLDDNEAIGRIDNHIVLVRSMMVPVRDHRR
jgi:hypothetical protein